ILLIDDFGCATVSTWRDEVTPLFDNNPPTPPVIETVTVDTAAQRAVICWFPSPEGDVQGYRVLNVLEEEIALTNDPSITSAMDMVSNIVINSQGYLVVARDTCGGNETSADDGVPHYTLNLDLEFFKCDQSTRVEWNAYENWEGGVEGYVIYGGINGTALQAIDTVPGDVTSYLHTGVPLEVDFAYVVKALSVNGYKPSLSPRTAVFTAYPEVPEFTYLSNVDVLGASAIEVKALIDPAAESTSYRFERLDRFGDSFEVLATLDQSMADADDQLSYIDFDVRPADRNYEYRVSVVDSCGNIPSVSDTCTNVRARISVDNAEQENYISWNPYVNWNGEVLNYRVYQVIDGQVGPLLGVVPPNIFYYVDRVDSLQDYLRDGSYCYLVEAVEGVNVYGQSQISRSNVICGTLDPLMFIPNAITPNGDGLNDFFAPVAGYFDRVDGYSMRIYDRWGQLVYETDDYYRPWKAEDANGYVQEGVYVYHIRFSTGDGQLYERYGNISVLIPESE
ncbi:MAG: gliding motility-associated C-terminal domain-containing protein, partial [Flavobacteriales bacterium]|nr:gliding motility-associated C-terminal domain-containing protein [Flavobacteriales bacterium]